jgi:hypothetical protein
LERKEEDYKNFPFLAEGVYFTEGCVGVLMDRFNGILTMMASMMM